VKLFIQCQNRINVEVRRVMILKLFLYFCTDISAGF
jgi:hypothetical protein